MNPNSLNSILIILLIAAITFFTRAIPFILFSGNKRGVSKNIIFLGEILPPAIIGMLVIYCLKNVTLLSFPYGLPEIISIFSIYILHIKFKNNLISIFSGTALYMFLSQFVFS